MSDGAIFTIGMFLFQLLLGPAILLILVLGGRAALRNKAGRTASDSPSPITRLGCGLMVLLPICAFGGVMVASAGGAIHPPLVTVAAPYVCDGTVETQSQNYSYKPGQQGVARNIFCIDPDGERRDITLRTVGRSEEHTSELQSLMRISYAVFCLKKQKTTQTTKIHQ